MKLIDFLIVGPEGKSIPIKVNPKTICLITIAMVPGSISAPDGTKTLKPGTVMDFGTKAVFIDLPINEVQKKLEQGE